MMPDTQKGRPKAAGPETRIGTRWGEPELAEIDDWRRKQEDMPARSQAIRRLVQLGLKASKAAASPKNASARAADASYAERAARAAIDRSLEGTNLTPDDRAARRRRLTKMPAELAKRRQE